MFSRFMFGWQSAKSAMVGAWMKIPRALRVQPERKSSSGRLPEMCHRHVCEAVRRGSGRRLASLWGSSSFARVRHRRERTLFALASPQPKPLCPVGRTRPPTCRWTIVGAP
jgi:hypothetical protein